VALVSVTRVRGPLPRRSRTRRRGRREAVARHRHSVLPPGPCRAPLPEAHGGPAAAGGVEERMDRQDRGDLQDGWTRSGSAASVPDGRVCCGAERSSARDHGCDFTVAGMEPLRQEQQGRQAEEGHLAPPAPQRLEAAPQPLNVTSQPNAYGSGNKRRFWQCLLLACISVANRRRPGDLCP